MQEPCKYGERCLRLDCLYTHNIKKRNVPCVHYQGRGCIKGDRCPYLHIEKTEQIIHKEQMDIDIAPSLSDVVSIPLKRPPNEDVELHKEFPVDISSIIDSYEDHEKGALENLRPEPLGEVVVILPAETEETFKLQEDKNENTQEIEIRPETQTEEIVMKPAQNLEAAENSEKGQVSEPVLENPVVRNGEIKDVENSELRTEPVARKEEIKTAENPAKPNDEVEKTEPAKIPEGKNIEEPIRAKPPAKTPDPVFLKTPSQSKVPEKPAKAKEETVSLPQVARKNSSTEKNTKILTLEEIKLKKKLEAELKAKENQEKSLPKPELKPAPVKTPAKIVKSPVPVLVSAADWEPFKLVLSSIDFSGLNLSQEELLGCQKLANQMSSPEGISQIIYELEEKLKNKGEVRVDSEFEQLSDYQKIEKLYYDIFK